MLTLGCSGYSSHCSHLETKTELAKRRLESGFLGRLFYKMLSIEVILKKFLKGIKSGVYKKCSICHTKGRMG
jgi:hypothetical protein